MMSNSQILGVRMFCLALGWAFGSLIFGTQAEWLWGIKSFIWCGFVGGTIGIMLTSKQEIGELVSIMLFLIGFEIAIADRFGPIKGKQSSTGYKN